MPPTRLGSLAVRINPFGPFTNWRNSSSLICLPSRQPHVDHRQKLRQLEEVCANAPCFIYFRVEQKVVSLLLRKSTSYFYSKRPRLVTFVQPLTMLRQCDGSQQRKNLVNGLGNRKVTLV